MSIDKTNTYTAQQAYSTASWEKKDTIWMLSLYGTAIGAGTLFLPIGAGLNGIWPLLLISLLVFPMTFYSHRALCRFVLSSSSTSSDITEVVDEYFGKHAGKLLTFLYFFAIYPILLMYSVAITNTSYSFIVNQLGMTPPPRALLALGLIISLMTIIRIGQDMIVRSMSILVYPFIVVLILFSLYLIPHWNMSSLHHSYTEGSLSPNFLKTIWLIIPVMVFSFNHSPIISSFAVSQKKKNGGEADEKCNKVLKYSHILMVTTVLFFVFSCVFSLTPADMLQAKRQNVSILSYLANHFHTPMFAYLAPFVAFIAIAKSFLGHYLGASEGLFGIIAKPLRNKGYCINRNKLQLIIDLFFVVTCWIVAVVNPSILGMIETLGGPIIAIILFLMPMYAIARVPAMKRFRHPASDTFIILIGLTALSAIVYGLF